MDWSAVVVDTGLLSGKTEIRSALNGDDRCARFLATITGESGGEGVQDELVVGLIRDGDEGIDDFDDDD